MIRVSELYSSSLPKEFLDTLQETCDVCGSPNEVSETLSRLECSNPRCPEKGVQRLLVLLQKDLLVDNIGEARIRKFMNNFDCYNPYGIFTYDPKTDGTLFEGCSMEYSESIYAQVNAKREMTLGEYVRIGNIPGIRDSALKLFNGYDSLDSFYADIQDDGVSRIQELLGIGNTDDDTQTVSVRAVAVYNALMQFRDELYQFIDDVVIKSYEHTFSIYISNSAGDGFKSKSDFKAYINKTFASRLHVNWVNGVSKTIDFLIWDGFSETTKVKKIKGYIESGSTSARLMTGSEFISFCKTL